MKAVGDDAFCRIHKAPDSLCAALARQGDLDVAAVGRGGVYVRQCSGYGVIKDT
jgi:hypothetical protein